MTFENLFLLGLKRELPQLLPYPEGIQIDLGSSGTKKVEGAISLGLPGWSWPHDRIPCEDNSVAVVHAYHFLEHLTGNDAIEMLKEIQRVLFIGGILQFTVPWANSDLAYQDLTHKSFWTEDSFRNLMYNRYYDVSANEFKWQFRQHYLVLAGIVSRNICLIGQLVKG